jgi:hypothetical protein
MFSPLSSSGYTVTDMTTCPALALFTAILVYILFVASQNTTSVQSVHNSHTRTVHTPQYEVGTGSGGIVSAAALSRAKALIPRHVSPHKRSMTGNDQKMLCSILLLEESEEYTCSKCMDHYLPQAS